MRCSTTCPARSTCRRSKAKASAKKKANEDDRASPTPDEPFCGLVFKVLPAKTGDMHWVRVYSGVLKAELAACSTRARTRRKTSPSSGTFTRRRRKSRSTASSAGDIVGVIGLRQSITGDTLCDTREPILLESIKFPETVISMAIEPESSAERKKLHDTLEMLKRQDPTLQVVSGETGQTLISGMGELHLEVIKNRLLRDFNLNVKFHKPQVSYRESIGQAGRGRRANATGMIAGQQLFAEAHAPHGAGRRRRTIPVMLLISRARPMRCRRSC